MAISSISCCLRTPAPPKEASTRRLQPTPPTTLTPWSSGLRRACAAAAACAVMGMADGGDMVLARDSTVASRADGVVAAQAQARAPPRWSDRRQCPPWRANSLENIVPENLPRPSARRRFNSITAEERTAPALAPGAVAPFLALHSGMGCFSL
ncbi:protein CHLOROPLAST VESICULATION-like [Phragmites australis]|uniref:protein CHLOROPLAST VESICULATION-like n=1 Tax=Phragmites australis TaxID=29695 RepID=UPI002D7688F9|nr:protein CHLOROPLAST VESICULATION-like [Phragmites australis]